MYTIKPLLSSQNGKAGITEMRESTLEISRTSHKEKQKLSRSEVAKSREESDGGQKLHGYCILFDMTAPHWRPRARLRDISTEIKFIRQDANRVFIEHRYHQSGGGVCVFLTGFSIFASWHDYRAQSLYSANIIYYFQEFVSDSNILIVLDYN